ncbi:MAG: ribbon-helix-helix domain-containing protein [Candidatus Thermoplasmatota archaeon]|nr:ribbon-helix-helix domain-containing protein [Candidatus Thermoplasmatota archaeon]
MKPRVTIRLPMNIDSKIEEIVDSGIWRNKSQFIVEAVVEKIRKIENNIIEDEMEIL